MDAHRTNPRVARVAFAVAVSLAVMATVSAYLLAMLVSEATDPAAWGTPPAIAWAAAMLIGFFAATVAALFAGRLLARAAGRPLTSSDAVTLAVFTAIGATAVSMWAFGVGIGLDPVPQWLNAVMIGAGAVALLATLVGGALISGLVRRRSQAPE